MKSSLEAQSMRPFAIQFIILINVTIIAGAVGRGQENAPDFPAEALQTVAKGEITEDTIRSHIRFLSDDALEGRAPGSAGDRLSQIYIQTQLEGLGIKPAGPEGSWFQKVPLVGTKTNPPKSIEFKSSTGNKIQLSNMTDYVVTSGKPEPKSTIENSELVFVGYGIEAPEFDWDDYKGVDVKGKVLVMLNNDPSDDPELFGGTRRLYYGRWDYKYLMAASKGAAGAFIIHTTPSAGYPYQVVQTSWSGEEFELASNSDPRMEMRGWLTEEAAKRVIKLSGNELDALRKKAQKRDFKPVPLKTTVDIALTCEIRKKTTANVLGRIEGTDPKLKDQHVIYMAHHDHIGMSETRDETGDNIYNGALDNASGVASMLAIAKAHSKLNGKTKRSILFAAVGAEEQGLLGSKHFAQNPTISPGNMAAVVNMDGINHLGPTFDINFIGFGKSSLDQVVQSVARFQNRIVTPDQFPDKGYYYRSDQFSLAKVGVPGIYLHSGVRVIGKPDGWGKMMKEKWVETNYHQPSDEYDDTWNLKGAVIDVQLLFYSGSKIANQKQMPHWQKGDEFEAARLKALKSLKAQ